MNIVDIMIILVLLVYIAKGFSNGVFREGISFAGGLLVIILAFMLKNPISKFLYQTMPFFKFSGMMSGISVLNIIVYEIVAFLAVATILLVVYELILKATNVFEKILRWTFVFALPSKLLGAVVGFIEGIVITFIILFVCIHFEMPRIYIDKSDISNKILSNTPFLKDAIEPIYNSLQDMYKVAEKYKDSEDKNSANLESLEILLKYNVLEPQSARVLIDNGKLTIDGSKELVDKYEKTDAQ